MTDAEMMARTIAARIIAQGAGTMHSYWDTIFDAEAILSGRQSLLPRSEIERILKGIDPMSYEQWAAAKRADIAQSHAEQGDEAFLASIAKRAIAAEEDRGGAPLSWMAMNGLYSDYGKEVFGEDRIAAAIEATGKGTAQ